MVKMHSGKTSLLKLYTLSEKKVLEQKNFEMIKYEKEVTKVYIKLFNGENFSINLMKNGKKLYINERTKYVEYIGNILAISFIPEDVELITGNPSIRRSFFNYEILKLIKNI